MSQHKNNLVEYYKVMSYECLEGMNFKTGKNETIVANMAVNNSNYFCFLSPRFEIMKNPVSLPFKISVIGYDDVS